ncbi:OLC1v1024431C1 [Oldenlandia corymbosa var. corymbosa]|uniref:OLC1v1024431C1 n=1 Tax=Oldenlandia corymbosa var. corymbosa TaxID=529605 RepID=A0AAV1C385_OLDCO|nr:OLC1v1024431C1 [Oldenlandia corymbosa var. corymbosa]
MEFMPQVMNRSNKCKRKKKSSMDSLLKVVYISSPMKVETSASRFRTLVQELTGRDSDISRYMDSDNNNNNYTSNSKEFLHQGFEIMPDLKRVSKSTADNHHHHQYHHHHLNSSSSFSPSSSESNLVEEQEHEHSDGPPTFDESFINEHFFQGLLSADLFSHDSSEVDVLGSYDAL